MNHATCIYRSQNAPLIELLALIEPTPDGYTIRLSESERPRYERLPLLAVAGESSNNVSVAGYRIDIGSLAFSQQVLQAIEAITESAPLIDQLQALVNLKPVEQDISCRNWSGFSQSDVVIFARHDLHSCLKVMEQIGLPKITFTSVASEAHAGELHDAEVQELRFRDGNQDYLAMSPDRWRTISATAATTLFEHIALITKIAGLLLSVGKPAHQLIRPVGLNRHGAALLHALNSLRAELRHANTTHPWARLRDFNEEIRDIRFSSDLASTSCNRYFTDSRRAGKTAPHANPGVPTPVTAKPVTVADRVYLAETEAAEAMPVLNDESLQLDSSDWPDFPLELTPTALPAFKPLVNRLTAEPGAAWQKHGAPQSGAYMTENCLDDVELITGKVEEDEPAKSANILIIQDVHPFSGAPTARAHPARGTIVPVTLPGSGVPGAQLMPNWQDVYSCLLPLPGLSSSNLHQPPAPGVDFADLRRRQATHYNNVEFGERVCLVGLPVIGSGTIVSDDAIIHERVCLPGNSVVKPGVLLSQCKFSDAQLTSPMTLVFSGDPSGTLHMLRFMPGVSSNLVEFETMDFQLSSITIVPGGVRFIRGGVVSHFQVGQTKMNNCCVEGSLLLMNPHLGNNVFFGPDVVVEANVTIGSNVLFREGNWIKAGSVIGDGAVIERRVNVSGTIAPGALVTNERAPELSGLPPGAAPAAPGSHMRSPVGMAPAGTELQAAGMPGAGKPRQAKPIKVLDLTGEDEVDAIP
ncbi:MAG: hypothetical protein ACJ8G3_26010, partial [Burkholderiaceae bacterium]